MNEAPPKTTCESNMVTSVRRHVVWLSWMLFVTLWRKVLSLLNTVTFDPFTLPSLPVDRRNMSSTVINKKSCLVPP